MQYNETALDRFWKKVKVGSEDECWPWTAGTTSAGYGWFRPSGRDVPGVNSHVFSYFLENGPVPPGKLVRHSCDNPPCCNPKHLIAGTPQQNMDDMKERNRLNPLVRDTHPKAKLSSEDEEFIRGSTRRNIDLAREFGVAKSLITRIKKMTPERREAENKRQRAARAKRRRLSRMAV